MRCRDRELAAGLSWPQPWGDDDAGHHLVGDLHGDLRPTRCETGPARLAVDQTERSASAGWTRAVQRGPR